MERRLQNEGGDFIRGETISLGQTGANGPEGDLAPRPYATVENSPPCLDTAIEPPSTRVDETTDADRAR